MTGLTFREYSPWLPAFSVSPRADGFRSRSGDRKRGITQSQLGKPGLGRFEMTPSDLRNSEEGQSAVFLGDVEFHQRLWRVHVVLVEELRFRRCPRRLCGGRLHRANFQRKVRGVTASGLQFDKRLGLCCGRCRRRVLPPAVRFFGRGSSAYIAVLVATVAALCCGGPSWMAPLGVLNRLW
jgi:hypothetical protein